MLLPVKYGLPDFRKENRIQVNEKHMIDAFAGIQDMDSISICRYPIAYCFVMLRQLSNLSSLINSVFLYIILQQRHIFLILTQN